MASGFWDPESWTKAIGDLMSFSGGSSKQERWQDPENQYYWLKKGWSEQIPTMVEAAKQAGLHPLAALGVSSSAAPIAGYFEKEPRTLGGIGNLVSQVVNRKEDAYQQYRRERLEYNELERSDAETKKSIQEAVQSEMDTRIKLNDLTDILNYGARVTRLYIPTVGRDGQIRYVMNPQLEGSFQDMGKYITGSELEWRAPMKWTNRSKGEFTFQRPWK